MKRVKDPVHDHIEVAGVALALIDRPEFQRLRRIRQTGTAHLVYPGANHTRFEHSLGSHHLATLAADGLGLSDGDRDLVATAGLLHDVGHGPFSHICEPALERHAKATHEELSARLIRGPLADTLEAHDLDPTAVAALVLGRHHLSEVISGPIDVDRIDYLLRDGHYTGVATSVDALRIVSHLTRHNGRIVLRDDAVGTAETLLVTRFAMHAAVYHHHSCRSGELLLLHALEAAIDSGHVDPGVLPRMDDVALLGALRASDGIARELTARVEDRRLYKVGLSVPYRELERRFLEANAGDTDRLARLGGAIAERIGAEPHEVLVDMPPVSTHPEVDAPVLGHDGSVRSLSDRSTLVRTLAEAQLDHLHLRVYAPARLRDEVAAQAPKEVAIERTLDEFGGG